MCQVFSWKLIPDPFDPFGGENSKAAPEEHQACNNYTAISNLSVGIEAQMTGFAYVQFPNSDDLSDDVHDETWSDLSEPLFESEYAYNYYLDKRHTPIYEVPLTDVSNPAIIVEATTIFAPPVGDAPIATILDGPYCTGRDLVDVCEHHWHGVDFCEGNSEGGEDEYSVWWKIEVEIQGATYTGWYPENIRLYGWWLWEENGLFDRVATAYLLTPIGMAMSVNDEACYPSQFINGMQVQAAQGTLNLRATPNGDIIGAIPAGEIFNLIASPVQQDGYLWWWTNRNGWIAELECDNPNAFIQRVVIVEETESTPVSSNPQSDSSDRDDSNNNNSGGREAPRSTPTPRQATFATPEPTRSSACDPATGRGC